MPEIASPNSNTTRDGTQNGLPRLYVGAYCGGLCATMLKAKHPNILIWITCSLGFNGSRDYVRAGRHDLFQGTTSPLKGACDKKFLGVDCDFDEANNPNWGWFVPWGNFTPEGLRTHCSILSSSL